MAFCLVAVLAAGCTQTRPPGQPAALPPPLVKAAPQQAIAAPPASLAPVGSALESALESALGSALGSAPTQVSPPDPAELLGAGPTAVETRLGRPAHVWREDPGAMWQYVKDVCVLSIYMHGAESGLKVIAIQARNRLDGKPADAACYAKFVAGSS